MKPRWIDEQGSAPPTVLDATVIARWWPGRYYRVSTISTKQDEESPEARLLRALDGIPRPDGKLPAPSKLPEFMTQVFRCDKYGMGVDFNQPLYTDEAVTEEQARRNHRVAVALFSTISFREIRPFANEARGK